MGKVINLDSGVSVNITEDTYVWVIPASGEDIPSGVEAREALQQFVEDNELAIDIDKEKVNFFYDLNAEWSDGGYVLKHGVASMYATLPESVVEPLSSTPKNLRTLRRKKYSAQKEALYTQLATHGQEELAMKLDNAFVRFSPAGEIISPKQAAEG